MDSVLYPAIKLLHVTCVSVSIVGFLLRGVLVLRDAPVMKRSWVRILPHVNDTVLLGSALLLAVLTAQYPFVAHWLTAKVLGLVVYIGLGVVALRGRTSHLRRLAFVAALAVLGWIVSVALTRHPAGVFSQFLGS